MCLDLSHGDISQNWRKFRQKFEIYIEAHHPDATNRRKCAILLDAIGDEALEIYSNVFTFEHPDLRYDLDTVRDKFEEYCAPRTNRTIEVHKFNSRIQDKGESVDSFISDLKKLAKNCNFTATCPNAEMCGREVSYEDDMVTYRIVAGILDKKTQEKLLAERNLTAQRATEICKAAEAARQQIESLAKKGKSKCGSQKTTVESSCETKSDKKERKGTEMLELWNYACTC